MPFSPSVFSLQKMTPWGEGIAVERKEVMAKERDDCCEEAGGGGGGRRWLSWLGGAEGGGASRSAVRWRIAPGAKSYILLYIWRLVLPSNVASPPAQRHKTAIFSRKKQQRLNTERNGGGNNRRTPTTHSSLPPPPNEKPLMFST